MAKMNWGKSGKFREGIRQTSIFDEPKSMGERWLEKQERRKEMERKDKKKNEKRK